MDLTEIEFQRDSGTQDMGDTASIGAQDDNVGRVARFYLVGRFALIFLRVHFSRLAGGSATGTADLTLHLDSHAGRAYDCVLWTWTGAGINSAPGDRDINFRIPQEELMHWAFEVGDELVLEWTNPNVDDIVWGAEAGLAYAENAK